jgi:benzoyl-CoA reductase/2-hydroxyglutaryl-CoA dehydratase subunit BcrC/BadD/HgdB
MSTPEPLVGITATLPIEIIFAGGSRPVDINNLFISSSNPNGLIYKAEAAGFSPDICAWIKGIYSTVITQGIKQIIAVTGGDCSNTVALGEVLNRVDVEVITFEYPHDQDKNKLVSQIDKLRRKFSTTWPEIEATRSRLNRIRKKLRRLDELTYLEDKVTGYENHLFLVQSSDFNGDPDMFEKDLDRFLKDAEKRAPQTPRFRLGYLGVPPIFSRFYETIESLGAKVVFNEVQRQFSMPFNQPDITSQYLEYTYPYDVGQRLEDIKKAIAERHLDGLIHYTQNFCYRQIYDIILRKELNLPILTLEGDRPGPIDSRILLRLETFLEMLQQRKPDDIT